MGNRISLFIDCDPGIDDLMALVYAAAHPQVDVVGAVASGGNVSTENVGRNLRGALELAGLAQAPWALGAKDPLGQRLMTTEETHGPFGTGYAELPLRRESTGRLIGEGAQLWIDTAEKYAGELDAVVLGPCTNLALALELDPELPHKLRSLYIMGGALNHRGNTMPTTEWNIHSDPEAAYKVFEAFSKPNLNCYPVLCPLDQTEKNEMTPQLRAKLCEGHTPVLRALDDALQFYMEFHESDGHGFMAHVHDPFVTALAVNDSLRARGDLTALELGESTSTVIDVELDGRLTRGQTIADWLGRWERADNARALISARPEEFFDHYINTVRTRFAHTA
ncbi:nucleoside hydrolase [uncultured Rothia sp.]|uniref:nucleoside hydrolase n=1 Tax=uncultured Rothia sp. TaxID=316088 RepID=UPI0032165AC7